MGGEAAAGVRLDGVVAGSLSYTAQAGAAAVYGGAWESPQVEVMAPGMDEAVRVSGLRLAPLAPARPGRRRCC